MASLVLRRLRPLVAVIALTLLLLLPATQALAADIKVKGVNDSYTLEVGGSRSQIRIVVSPTLETSPEIRTTLVLRAALDGKIPQLEITGGKALEFTHDNFVVAQDITVTVKGEIAPGLTTVLTLSGVGIETKTTTIKTVAPESDTTGSTTDTTTTGSTATEVPGAPNEASPCYDGTTGPLRDCTLSERIADKTGFVYIAWQSTRTIINLILIIALLMISFSNILRINIDTYTVKKALPNLVIGVILANASFLIIRYMADIATVTVYLFVNQTQYTTFSTFVSGTLARVGIGTLKTLGEMAGAGAILAPIIILVLGLIVIVGLFWLAFLLYFRLVAIYLLTILAPLAFVAYGIPGMDKYFKQWWQLFIKWLFILPAMSGVFWIMYVVAISGKGESIAKTIIQFFLFFTALTIPSKMGGAIIDKASSAFKKAGSFAVDKSGAKDLGRDLGSRAANRVGITRVQEWNKLRKEKLEKNIELRRKGASRRARDGRVGQQLAGLVEDEKLQDETDSILKINQERIARAQGDRGLALAQAANTKKLVELQKDEEKAGQEQAAYTPAIAHTLERAEIKKTMAEAEKEANQSREKLAFETDPTNKDFLFEFSRANSKQNAMKEAVSRQEKILHGGYNTSRTMLTKNILRTKELENERMALDPVADAAKIDEIDAALGDIHDSFEANKAKHPDFAGKTVAELADQLNEVSAVYDAEFKQVLEAENVQNLKSFSAGVKGQIEDESPEQSAKQISLALDKVLEKLTPADQQRIISGDSIGIDGNTQRDFIVETQKLKDKVKNTRDANFTDAAQSLTDLILTTAGKTIEIEGTVYDGSAASITALRTLINGDQNSKQKVSAALFRHETLAGQPGNRFERDSVEV